MSGSVSEAAAAVDRTRARFTTLLRSGLDTERRVKDSTWTIRDLGSHLAGGVLAYRQMAEGEPSPYADINERAETNQSRLEATSHLSLDAMADIIDSECARVVAALRAQPDDAMIAWHGGLTLPARAVLGAMVGEFLFHGLDLARTVGARWPIERVDALPAVDVFTAVSPHLLVRDAVRDLTASVEVRCRGYDTSTFEFRDGELTVTPGPASRADVHMSVDPVSFLLVGYKRGGLAKPIATGRALAWGRRPWLALRFPGFFQAP